MTDEQKIAWMPRDVIAVITLGGGFGLLALGIDGTVGIAIMAVVAFYFGVETLERTKRA